MGKVKKRRRNKDEEPDAAVQDSGSDDDSEVSVDEDADKYAPFRVPNYVRFYPEDGGNFEYIVFLESADNEKPIGNRDMMSLANVIKRYNKGVKQLHRINKSKIGVIFERPALANAALNNKKFLDTHKLIASIPAAATEVTGVIIHVPIELSNKQIYSALTSTKNIVSIRRFMKKNPEFGPGFQPTKTVSITFSCPVLPESVDLNSWRFEVRPYIPPVKQCLRCLRYGHIAKYCKNAERCSICGEGHNFKSCQISASMATCCHCKGNHIAISSACPIKQEKIRLNKEKFQKKSYANTLKEGSFPSLNKMDNFISLLNSDLIIKVITESLVKLITLNKNNEQPISSQCIKDVLQETFKKQNNNNK